MCKKRLGTTGTVLLPLHESPPPGDSRSIRPGPGASVRRDWVIPPFLRHDAACFPSSGGAISSDSARMPALFKIRFSRPRDPLNFSVRLTLPDSASLRLRVSTSLRVSEGQHAPRAQWIHGHSPKPPAALARAASALGPPPGRGQSESVAVWARWRRVAARHWPPVGPEPARPRGPGPRGQARPLRLAHTGMPSGQPAATLAVPPPRRPPLALAVWQPRAALSGPE